MEKYIHSPEFAACRVVERGKEMPLSALVTFGNMRMSRGYILIMSKSDRKQEALLRTAIIGQVPRTLTIRATPGTGTPTMATSTTTTRTIRTMYVVFR